MRLHFAGGLLPRVPSEDCVSGFQLGVETMWQRGARARMAWSPRKGSRQWCCRARRPRGKIAGHRRAGADFGVEIVVVGGVVVAGGEEGEWVSSVVRSRLWV